MVCDVNSDVFDNIVRNMENIFSVTELSIIVQRNEKDKERLVW